MWINVSILVNVAWSINCIIILLSLMKMHTYFWYKIRFYTKYTIVTKYWCVKYIRPSSITYFIYDGNRIMRAKGLSSPFTNIAVYLICRNNQYGNSGSTILKPNIKFQTTRPTCLQCQTSLSIALCCSGNIHVYFLLEEFREIHCSDTCM